MSSQRTIARLVVLALALGGLPADADENGHPFGLAAKQQTLWAKSVPEMNSWKRRYSSLADFVQTVRQDDFKTLSSGETADAYYVVFRAEPDLLVFADAFKKEDPAHSGYDLHGKNGNQGMFYPMKPVDLLDTEVVTTLPGMPGSTQFQGYSLIGFAAQIHHDYAGPLTLNFQWWNEGRPRLKASCTFNWTSGP